MQVKFCLKFYVIAKVRMGLFFVKNVRRMGLFLPDFFVEL